MNDHRFSRRWSQQSDPTNLSALSSGGQSQDSGSYARSSSSSPSRKNRSTDRLRQRCSTVPPASRLSIVETIEYDSEEAESTSSTAAGPDTFSEKEERERSRRGLRDMFMQMFKWGDTSEEVNVEYEPTSKPARRTMLWRTTLVTGDKEGSEKGQHETGGKKENGSTIWRRLTVVIRPTKPPKVEILEVEKEGIKDRWRYRASKNPALQSLPDLHGATSSMRSSRSKSSLVPPLPTPNQTPLALTPMQLEEILAQLKIAMNMLKQQEEITESFSKNLASLLWQKEHAINANTRVNSEAKSQMVGTLARVRDQTAKAFCRKGMFLERSQTTLSNICTPLESVHREYVSARPRKSSDSDSSSSSSSSNTLVACASENKLTVPSVTIQVLQQSLTTLKADLTAQGHLDPTLRNTVVLPTQEARFPTSENERVAMRRFVRFVDDRVKALRDNYWQLGRWVWGLESWLDDLIEEA